MTGALNNRSAILVCLLLAVITLAVYWQVTKHDFISLDDNLYITENRHVQAGLTWEGLKWAFTTGHTGNWHPLTWLSHMLDCRLFGLNAGRHHGMSVLFHIASTLLLFLALQRMTKNLWPSAFVAALFALHPLHVESVAWAAERKDVLSAFFWMLTILAYVYYTELPGIKRYLLVVLFFVLGLMSKPMLVTLPFVLLLLDHWPLCRFYPLPKEPQKNVAALRPDPPKPKKIKTRKASAANVNAPDRAAEPTVSWANIRALIWEKAPLFALSAVSSVITYYVQQKGGNVAALEAIPLDFRIANAVVSYTGYIGKMIWPFDLAVFYPHPGMPPLWQIFGALALLLPITFASVWTIKRYAYFGVGWFWYLGTLVPVIGLVQVGKQAMADRYTYIPLVGLFIMIAWGVTDFLRHRQRRIILGISATATLCLFTYATWMQLKYWKNSMTLFQSAINRTENNSVAHFSIAFALHQEGRLDEAVSHYQKALQIDHRFSDAHNNIGNIFLKQARPEEAIGHFTAVLRIDPNHANAVRNLGDAFSRQGKFEDAAMQYARLLKINPKDAAAHLAMANIMIFQGKHVDAETHIQSAVAINPTDARALVLRGDFMAAQGRLDEAVADYFRAVQHSPNDAELHYNIGTILAMQRKFDEAMAQFREAVRIKPDYARAHNNIGGIFMLQGNIEAAIESFRQALSIKPDYAVAGNNLNDALSMQKKRK